MSNKEKAYDDPVKNALSAVNADNTVLFEMIEHNRKVASLRISDLEQEIAILRDELKNLKMTLRHMGITQ